MKKKILFLQPTFDQDLPRNIRTKNIVEFLKEYFDITILCYESETNKKNIQGVKTLRISLNYISKYIFLKDVSMVKLSGLTRFFSRAINFIFRNIYFPDPFCAMHINVINAIKDQNFDIIIASVVPFSSSVLAHKIKKNSNNLNSLIVLDIGDPLARNAAGIKHNLKKLEFFEKAELRKANLIIVTNDDTKNYYIHKLEIAESKIFVIPQGSKNYELENSSRGVLSKNIIKLIYAGIFYKSLRDPSEFIKAIKNLNHADLNVDFYGVNKEYEFECTKTNVNFNERIDNESLANFYLDADYLLYFDNAYGIQTSGKIYELLSTGKPIICIYSNIDSPVVKEVSGYNNIIFVKNNSSEIEKTLIEILNDRCIFDKLILNYNPKDFSWENRARMYREVLNTLN